MYLGLDLGTSGLRGLIVNPMGAPIGATSASYEVAHPQPGWSEQDPSDWTRALDQVIADLAAAHPSEFRQIASIGVSGHMHGATLLDAGGEVLRPCILWNDTRSHQEAAALDAAPGVRDVSGNIVFPGFTAPKLVWLKTHEPQVYDQVAKVLLPAAYMNFYLTGEYFADMSDSAGTSWLDSGGRDWSDALLTAGGMRAEHMPRLVEGSEVGGSLRPDLAKRWGLSDTVTVVGGAGDNAAAACGVGAMGEGQGFVSLGTSGVLLTGRNAYAPLPASAVHTFCHAVPQKWYQMGVILAATDSLNWFAKITGQSAEDLSKGLPAQITGPSSIRFLPYLSGERTPHNDAAMRGAFIGLGVDHGPADLTQAVMEGVGFALADCAAALRATGAELGGLYAIGGGAKARFWVQTLATILNLPLALPQAGDFGAALGAARLAMVGDGCGSVDEIMQRPPVAETIDPIPTLTDTYQEAAAHYRALYPALKDIP